LLYPNNPMLWVDFKYPFNTTDATDGKDLEWRHLWSDLRQESSSRNGLGVHIVSLSCHLSLMWSSHVRERSLSKFPYYWSWWDVRMQRSWSLLVFQQLEVMVLQVTGFCIIVYRFEFGNLCLVIFVTSWMWHGWHSRNMLPPAISRHQEGHFTWTMWLDWYLEARIPKWSQRYLPSCLTLTRVVEMT
jgi:hypothetical protein